MTCRKSLLLVAVSLILVEVLCFGPIASHSGFYLDDWATLAYLHFAPKDFFGLLHHYLIEDGRVLIRPVEVLHYGTIYFFCGDQPLLYHIVNAVFELISSLLFYFIALRLTAMRSLAYGAALLLLIYPSHDATHYWVIASSVQLSFMLYLASLLAAISANDLYLDGRKAKALIVHGIGFLFYLSMLLNFESKTPLAATTVLACLALAYRRSGNWKKSLFAASVPAGLLILAIVSYWVFLKIIVPMLGHGYAHAIKFSFATLFATLARGLAINTPFEALPFFAGQAQAAISVLTSSEIVRLAALTVVAVGVLFAFLIMEFKKQKEGEKKSIDQTGGTAENQTESLVARAPLLALDLLLLGLWTVFVSYTIFGLSPDYMPTYLTFVNRINTGSSAGVMLTIVAVCLWLRQVFSKRPDAYAAGLTAAATACVLLFTLADWGMSKPWIVSWTTQKQVHDAVAKLAGKIDPGASILLISCPRYVMWAPVFDGVWDFQNMVRITLNQPAFNANVVSERLSITPSGLKDVSYGYECGSYPFNKLFLMVAPHPELIPAHSPGVFIDTVEQKGLTFGLDKKTLSKWREQAAQTTKLEASH